MQVKINGKSEEVQGPTILDLLKVKSIDPHMVAVELNAAMVERELEALGLPRLDHLKVPSPGLRASKFGYHIQDRVVEQVLHCAADDVRGALIGGYNHSVLNAAIGASDGSQA